MSKKHKLPSLFNLKFMHMCFTLNYIKPSPKYLNAHLNPSMGRSSTQNMFSIIEPTFKY